jgi:hypothetical protein
MHSIYRYYDYIQWSVLQKTRFQPYFGWNTKITVFETVLVFYAVDMQCLSKTLNSFNLEDMYELTVWCMHADTDEAVTGEIPKLETIFFLLDSPV